MSRRDDIRAAVEKHDKPIAKTTKGSLAGLLGTQIAG